MPSPPFLILFINSICNLKCDHCFYWNKLNRQDDLTSDEIFSLSNDMGKIENLNISGGEPFLRKDFGQICRYFVQNNRVEQIYVPTNAYFKEKTVQAIIEVLKEKDLKLFAIEISLDGMQEYHNRLRGSENSFQKTLETYDALVELQKRDSRLRIHAVSTVNTENMDEVRQLSTYLYDRCPAIDHHNIALIRGDRKNSSLQGPDLKAYEELFTDIQNLWAPREEGRFGGIVDPMLQWVKVQTADERRQVVPCCAGVLSAVVYANGDVSVCENLTPIGNLRQKNFKGIWHSYAAGKRRLEIKNKKCYCTNEMFLWPSIVFQPLYLIKIMLKAKVWRKPVPLKAKAGKNTS